jgi:isochorismate hydrolase
MKLNPEKILKELGPYREKKVMVNSERAALLVIDIQIYFRRIVQPILKSLLKVIQSCRQKDIPMIFTQHGHTDPTSDGGVLRQWWGQVILQGTEDWKFLPEIKIESKDIVLPKKRYSAFYETDLEEILRSKGIQDLIISGVMTNLCCETTARDAFMRDYRVFFLIDGTATGKEDHHLATLKNLGFGFAYLITCDELIKNLKSK